MANEKKTNEMENVIPEAVAKTEAPAQTEYNPFAWMDDPDRVSQVGDESETIFKPKMKVFRKTVVSAKDGKQYDNYAIGLVTRAKGTDLELNVNLAPNPRNGAGFALLSMIFGDDNIHDLEIVKTVTTYDGEKTTRYSLQVTAEDDSGAKISCPLTPVVSSGRVVVNNIISVLKNRGEIT